MKGVKLSGRIAQLLYSTVYLGVLCYTHFGQKLEKRVQRIDLVVVGPDDALAPGLTDALQGHSIPVFGPTRAASSVSLIPSNSQTRHSRSISLFGLVYLSLLVISLL